jgi:hypothetical protein
MSSGINEFIDVPRIVVARVFDAQPSARARPPALWNARTFGMHDPFGNTMFVIGPRRD